MRKPSFIWLSPTLTALGRRFGIDAHYFAKNSSLVLLGHAVSILRGIITGYFVARFFQAEVYGQYQFILSAVGLLSIFGLPGLAHSVTRAWARGDAFSVKHITSHQLKVCLIGSVILLGCIPFLGYYGRQELWLLFLVAALLFPLSHIATIQFGGFTVGKSRFDIALRATITWSIFMIIATCGIIFFKQSAVLMLLASMSIPSLVYLYYSRTLRPPAEKGSATTKGIIRYGWQLTFATLPVDIVWYLDKLLISHWLGLQELAVFSVSLLIPEQAKLFMKQFLPISFAKQAKGKDSKERRIKLMKIVLVGTLVFAAGISVYIVLSPFFIPLLFPNYDAMQVVILTSVTAATLITMPATLFAQYLEAQGMIREIRMSNWSAAVIFGLSSLTLIPLYGLMGAVIARGIFRFVNVLVTWWFILRSPIATATPID